MKNHPKTTRLIVFVSLFILLPLVVYGTITAIVIHLVNKFW